MSEATSHQTTVNIDGEVVAVQPRAASRRTTALCSYCHERKPQLQRPKTGCKVCKACFIQRFEEEIHHTIITNNLFTRGETVRFAIILSLTHIGHIWFYDALEFFFITYSPPLPI